MSICVKEKCWNETPNNLHIILPLKGKLMKDVDVLQTSKYLKVKPKQNIKYFVNFICRFPIPHITTS